MRKYWKKIPKEQTEAEKRLWQKLRGHQFKGIKFRRQYGIGIYIADFYCSSARLVIEIDGKIHEQSEQMEYDTIRENEIKARDITVIRFTNEHVLNNINHVLETISKAIKDIKNP